MAGRTVSAYVSEKVAASVAQEARREDRPPAQIAAMALKFFVSLPRDARTSLTALENLATDEERRAALNEVARVLNIAEFEMTCRHMAATPTTGPTPEPLEEDELDRAAVELTRAALRRSREHG
jgi:hypothetical protein